MFRSVRVNRDRGYCRRVKKLYRLVLVEFHAWMIMFPLYIVNMGLCGFVELTWLVRRCRLVGRLMVVMILLIMGLCR